MADLSITAANVLASAAATRERRFVAGATITTGQCVYLDDNEQWQLYDANGTAGHEPTRKRGIAEHGAASGQPLSVCTKDPEFTLGATMTAGTTVYGSATAGGVTHDVPASGQYNLVLGSPKSITKLNLNPTMGGAV